MQARQAFDVVVVGAGIAGATAAAALAPDHRVALIEAEPVAGYHTTGRSAAMWDPNYGPPDIRALTRASREFFLNPPSGFADAPLFRPRATVLLAPRGQEDALAQAMQEGAGLHPISVDAVRAQVPALKPGYAVAAAIEDASFDMDVAALHAGYLRQLRAAGGVMALRSRSGSIQRSGGEWHVETTEKVNFAAPVLVNCAGAWADEVAEQAGVAPLGVVPKRRTACIVDAAPWHPADWPMIHGMGEPWYARCEARTKLLVSPTDETATHAHDVQPEEDDIALAIDRMQAALDIDVRRIEHSWAGLRSFTPDGNFAFGWDRVAAGFFWCVGQGGYGIQTSPAAGRLVADLIAGRDPGAAAVLLPTLDPGRFQA